MHLKFLARGTGSAAVAAAYLLALKDASGKVRAAVEVLRGDPMLVAAVADGLPFMHRYTSGVAAWSPEDAPSRPELERFVDEFQKTAWAGLDRDRYVWAAVLHRDEGGGVHLHFFAARCDLTTGLSLNIAPPGWERTFDPLRDAFNYEHGWSRPDDPSRARPFRPAPHRAYQARAAHRAGEDVKPDPRREIGMHLLELVAAGRVKDRAGVVAALEARGYDVPRQGEHYVTARDPATGERWRLKGALYERGFERARFLRDAPEPSADRDRADDVDDPAAAAWEAVEKARRRRADYNRAYYGPVAGEVARTSSSAAGRTASHDASLAAHLERELGDGAVIPAESTRDRMAAADGGGRVAGAVALAEAARAAGPDLSRALSEHVAVRERERAVWCTPSVGEQRLAEAQQVVGSSNTGRRRRHGGVSRPRKGLARRPSAVALKRWRRASRLRSGRPSRRGGLEYTLNVLEPETARRVESGQRARVEGLAAGLPPDVVAARRDGVQAGGSGEVERESGPERSSAEAARAARPELSRALGEHEDVADRERAVLRTQEEALRAIPPGKRYLSEAEQARAAEVAGPPTLADRESMVRAAMQQVGEELDRLEEELVAIAVGEDLRAEAAGVLAGDGRTRSLGERWETCERLKSGVEEELDRREAAIRADSAGEELLCDARLEVLGAAGRETATLGDRARIVKAAAEAQQKWNEEKTARIAALGALPGGLDLYRAHLANLELAKDVNGRTTTTRRNIDEALTATESDGGRQERLRVVLSDEADAVHYREVLSDSPGRFSTATLDRALVAGERAREEREASARRSADLETAAEEAQAAAARSNIELRDAHVREIYETGETHAAGLAAVSRTTEALNAAADQRLPTDTIVGTWNGNRSEPGGIAAALDAATARLEEEHAAAVSARRAADLETATEEAQAAAARSNVELRDAHVREIYETGETHESGLSAVERTTAALAAAADQQLPTATIVGTWNANKSSPGGIAAALDAATAVACKERKAAEERVAALAAATAATRSAASRSNVKLDDAHVRKIYETGETHESGLSAVERTTVALASAADHQLPTATIIDTWKANVSAPGGIAAALVTKTRVCRVERLFRAPRAAEAFMVALDERDPSSRTPTHPSSRTPTHPSNIDQALDIAEQEFSHEAEQQFPGASSATGRRAGDDVTEAADTDRHVQQAIDWLRTEVERQQLEALRARTGTARLDQRNRNSVTPIVEKSPPVRKLARLVPAATWEDAEPLVRALTDLETASEPHRLDERARHAVTAVVEKTPPVPKPARLVPDATQKDVGAAALVRAERVQEERRQTDAAPRLTFAERYSQQWPEHADDIRHPDFEELAVGAEARNKLFERRELYSSKWRTADPEELPISLAKSGADWTDVAVQKVTWQATPGVGNPERTLSRQIVDAHLDGYGHWLPEQYAHSAEWRAIRERAEEAVRKRQDSLWYKRADRKGDDRQKRTLEAKAINRACGRDARRLHKEMLAAREAARPAWEITVRIRAVRDLIRKEEGRKLQQEQQAPERPVHSTRFKRGPTKEQGQSRDR